MVRSWVRPVVLTLLGLGYVATLTANLPGQLSYDSVFALYQIRHGLPLTFDPPMLNALLWLAGLVLPGPAVFVACDVLLFFGALTALVYTRPTASPLAIPVLLVIMSLPIILITQATVWHDVLFANLSLAGFCSLAAAGVNWGRTRTRNALLALSIALFVAAALTRQNGFIVLAAGVVAVFAVASRANVGGALRVGAAALAGALVLLAAANGLFSLRHANATDYASGLRQLQEFDIAGVASIDPRANLSLVSRGDTVTETMLKAQALGFNPQRFNALAQTSPKLSAYFASLPDSLITNQWKALISTDTFAYLHHRIIVFAWTFFTPDITKCLPVVVGTAGKREWAQDLNIPYGIRAQDAALFRYATRFFQTVAYSHAFYALLAICSIVVLLLRAEPADIAVAAMLGTALLVTASYYVISFSCDFRFLYILDVASLAGVFYVCVDPPKPKDPARFLTLLQRILFIKSD